MERDSPKRGKKLCESREEKMMKYRELRNEVEAKREERKYMGNVVLKCLHLGLGDCCSSDTHQLLSSTGGHDRECMKGGHYPAVGALSVDSRLWRLSIITLVETGLSNQLK